MEGNRCQAERIRRKAANWRFIKEVGSCFLIQGRVTLTSAQELVLWIAFNKYQD